jgi:hypothetical protein
MSPGARPRRRLRDLAVRARAFLVALVLGVALVGCQAAFDPSGPCTVDGNRPGAYPDLEALVPTTFQGRAPDRLDSGRNCTEERLGTLWSDGIHELRYAGGLWSLGSESGVTLAVFRGDGLSRDRLAAFYEAGARSAPDTADFRISEPSVGGEVAKRLDLDNDGYLQTVIVIPGPEGTLRAALVSSAARDVPDPSAHEANVASALEAFVGTASAGPSDP